MISYDLESTLGTIVAGVDEAGRGPWAGPVVASAVILNPDNIPAGINDSKKLSEKKRIMLYQEIINSSQVGIGIVSVQDIDKLNILQASLLAMQIAVNNLPVIPDMALIDGNKTPDLQCKSKAIINGDSLSLSIAAGSIIAKVTRDNIMQDLDKQFPQYDWKNNSGYGTKKHQEAINNHGITIHHRISFKPIKNIIQKTINSAVKIS
jgi:ribonuclease HII